MHIIDHFWGIPHDPSHLTNKFLQHSLPPARPSLDPWIELNLHHGFLVER